MVKIAWSEVYAHPLPEGHRFPMEKYNLIPGQLLHEGTITPDNLFTPQPIQEADILLAHDAEYWRKLSSLGLSPREVRATGFPHSAALILREQIITQGTLDCAHHALRDGVSLNTSGGTHHAFRDRGEGFCLLNDIAVAASVLLRDKRANRIIIIDLDVHQGNGTAAIFQNEPRVFTLSVHCEGNFPHHKERSSRDIGLPPGTSDDAYLNMLAQLLPDTIDAFQPDFAFFLSGVDVFATDKLGRLGMTREGCRLRDVMVFEQLKSRGIPVAVSMGGGYSQRLTDIVEAHCNTFRTAIRMYA